MSAPSIHSLPVLEKGGQTARRGFLYQDHVAVSFCVEMLTDGQIDAVWCEVHDDITLLSTDQGKPFVEFVQVKSSELDQMWSTALITDREKKSVTSGQKTKKVAVVGTSILERSLAQARCEEQHRFRIVTAVSTNSELKLLTYKRDAAERAPATPSFAALLKKIGDSLDGVDQSGAQRLQFWLESVLWEVRGSESAVRDATTIRLTAYLHDLFDLTAPDHVQAVYDFLLQTVERAAVANVPLPYDAKKLHSKQVLSDLKARIAALKRPYASAGGSPLKLALTKMGLLETDREHILVLHRQHRAAVRRQEYLTTHAHSDLYSEVEQVLHMVRLEYRRDSEGDTQAARHLRCIKAIGELLAQLKAELRVPIQYLQGLMYEMVDRGLHTFERGD